MEQNSKNHYCHYCYIEKDRILLLKILGLLKERICVFIDL